MMRVLRLLLPLAALVMVALAVFWPELNKQGGRFDVRVAPVEDGAGAEEAMVGATYTGVDKKGRPFSIKADRISNVADAANMVKLVRPDGQMALEDGTLVTIVADRGTYDRDRRIIELDGNVVARRGPDVIVETSRATIEVDAGSAVGHEPVAGKANLGTIKGQGFRIVEQGAKVFVTGPAEMLIYQGAETRLP